MRVHMLLQYYRYSKKGRLKLKTISKTVNLRSKSNIYDKFVLPRLKKLGVAVSKVAQLVLSTQRGNFVYSLREAEEILTD